MAIAAQSPMTLQLYSTRLDSKPTQQLQLVLSTPMSEAHLGDYL
jgi:hypothetical protein